MTASKQPVDGAGRPGGGTDSPLSDQPLLDLLDALVSDRGRVAAAEALGVNYRTMMTCYDSRRVSRRMRQALEEFRGEGGGDVDPVVLDDADVEDMQGESLERRVAALEDENRGLRELVERQKGQIHGEWPRWKGPGKRPTIPKRWTLAMTRIMSWGRTGVRPGASPECPMWG